jgi:hypothetical protein
MIFLFVFLILVRCLSYILHLFIFNDISNTLKKKKKKNLLCFMNKDYVFFIPSGLWFESLGCKQFLGAGEVRVLLDSCGEVLYTGPRFIR